MSSTMYRQAYDDLDNALAKLDAFIRLISHFQDLDPADRPQHAEGEGFLVEVMMLECHRARQAFSACWADHLHANQNRRA